MNVTGAQPRAADYAWAAVVALIALGFMAGLVSALWQVATGRGFGDALWLPVGLVSAWWLGLGAWRRTVWGRVRRDDELA